MNPAEVATALLIERTLQDSPAYRKVDDSLYVIKQGSAYVMISVVPWGDYKAMLQLLRERPVDIDALHELRRAPHHRLVVTPRHHADHHVGGPLLDDVQRVIDLAIRGTVLDRLLDH